MIISFKCRDTEKLYMDLPVRRFHSVERIARRKLVMIAIAAKLDDLRSPPGNMLKGLHGNRQGQYSIRINDQYRVCFIWKQDGAHAVEIVDYH